MYNCIMYSKQLLKGSLKTIILTVLKERGRMYGYEITQHVKSITEEGLVLTEGALYPALHKLEAEGFLLAEKESIGRRVRKYYSLSEKGMEAVAEKVNEFDAFVQMMQLILHPKTSKS